MDLYKEILMKCLENSRIEVVFPELKLDVEEAIATKSYKTLQKIKEIIEDDSLEDEMCFIKIEEIVRQFEEIGLGVEHRHDF